MYSHGPSGRPELKFISEIRVAHEIAIGLEGTAFLGFFDQRRHTQGEHAKEYQQFPTETSMHHVLSSSSQSLFPVSHNKVFVFSTQWVVFFLGLAINLTKFVCGGIPR